MNIKVSDFYIAHDAASVVLLYILPAILSTF